MTKEELIKLKKKLDNKFYEYNESLTNGPMSEFEILESIDNEGAIQNLEDYFESVIKYYSKKESDFNEIIIYLKSSIFVSKDSFNDEYELKEKVHILDDIALIDATFMCKNDTEFFGEDPTIVYPEEKGEFIIQISKFKELLKERGYELEIITSTEDIKQLVLSGKPAVAQISLSFVNKNKNRKQRIRE